MTYNRAEPILSQLRNQLPILRYCSLCLEHVHHRAVVMASLSTRGTDAWVERISTKEMLLCSTVRMLEQMAKDDVLSG